MGLKLYFDRLFPQLAKVFDQSVKYNFSSFELG